MSPKTRVEEMMDEKTEKIIETGMKDSDVILWEQLQHNTKMIDEELAELEKGFKKWVEENEDLQEMITVQKSQAVMRVFKNLLNALDAEKQFLLEIIRREST
jgi:galactose-1-phosphate uridylyltransferase